MRQLNPALLEMVPCIDMHVHLGRSRDGAFLTLPEMERALDRYGIGRVVLFTIDEAHAGPTYEKANQRVLEVARSRRRIIPFVRLNPRAGRKVFEELERSRKLGARGVKLHPRSEKFSPRQAEALMDEIEKKKFPVILHTSHEPHCGPLEWEKTFRRHRRTAFILAHAGKDAFLEAITVAERNQNVWLETSTLSYWRTGMILRKLGAGRVVFGSDLPYSHPAVERMKLDLLMGARERRKVYGENPRRILGE